MSSSTIVSNNLFNLFQVIDREYDNYIKNNKTASYDSFYTYLNTDVMNALSPQGISRKNILGEIIKSAAKIRTIGDNDTQFYNLQIREDRDPGKDGQLIKRKRVFTIILVLIVMGFIAMYILIIKNYKNDLIAGIRMIIILTIIMNVVIFLYGLLIRYINMQIKMIESMKRQSERALSSYKNLFYKDISTDFKKLVEEISIYLIDKESKRVDQQTKLREDVKKRIAKEPPIDEDQFINQYWDNSLKFIIMNIHANGTGAYNLKIKDALSTNMKTMKGVNDTLENYYNLILKSRISRDDSLSKDNIIRIIDDLVISELKAVNIMSIADDTTQTDIAIQGKMSIGENYNRLIAGYKYFIYYMYLVFRNTPYKKIIEIQQDENIDDDDAERIRAVMKKYPTIESVVEHYPITKTNFVEEIQELDKANSRPEDVTNKEIIEAFINFTVDTFVNVETTKSDEYYRVLNSIPVKDIDKTISEFKNFSLEFDVYFEKLYTNFIYNEFAYLNANANQYFMFKPEFILSRLDLSNIFSQKALTMLEDEDVENPKKYRVVIEDVIKDIVKRTEKRFREKHFDYLQDPQPEVTLKTIVIKKRLDERMNIIVKKIEAYNFKISDYSQYILGKLVGTNNETVMRMSGFIEDIITRLDYDIVLLRNNKPKIPEDPVESRFVSLSEFVAHINNMKFDSMRNGLQLDILTQLVTTYDKQHEDAFIEQDYRAQMGKWSFQMLTFIIVLLYILYSISLFQEFKEDKTSNKLSLSVYVGYFIKYGLPFATLVLLVTIFNAYVSKNSINIDFNKERMSENTNSIKSEVAKLVKLFDNIDNDLTNEQKLQSIGTIQTLDDKTKQQLYESIKKILISYDKCNYIIGTGRYELPFPYAEVFADGLMSVIIIGIIVYCIIKFAPIKRVVDLKELYEYKESSVTLVNDTSFIQEVKTKVICHADDVESIMFTVKGIAALSVIIFMLLYSVKIMDANVLYKNGLNTSVYMQQSKCVGK
jgi:hypothetical protein